jgi:hypothetical protein
MKQGLVLLFCATALSGFLGCSKNSDSGDGGSNDVSPKAASVIGESTKVGVFPDGTPAQPLSDQQMADVGKVTQGALTVNQAVSKIVPPPSLERSTDASVEIGQVVISSQMVPKLLSLRAALRDATQFEQDLSKCIPNHTKSQTQESGSDTEKDIGWQEGTTVGGVGCPVDSVQTMIYRLHMWRLGEKSAKAKLGVDLTYNIQMQNEADQLQFDFVGQSFSGRIEGEMLILEKSQEAALNGRIQGQLKTKTQGDINTQILFDLHSLQNLQPSSSQNSATSKLTASSIVPVGSIDLTAAVIIETSSGKLLLQVFATGAGDQGKVLVYLNGKELKLEGTTNQN